MNIFVDGGKILKKIIASSVLATTLLLPTLSQAESFRKPVSMLVDQSVEIRKGATHYYPLVTSLPIGKSVTVIDEFTNTTGERWYRVDLGNTKGWGNARHFTSKHNVQVPLQAGQKAAITENQVNVRKGATISYAIVTKLSKGTKVKIIDNFKNSSNELWYQIEVGSTKGWVIQNYLNPIATTRPTPSATESKLVQADKVAVRKGATESYSIVKYVYKNQNVTIIDTFKNAAGKTWYRTDLGNIKGWIPADAFSTEESMSPETKPVNSIKMATVSADILNVRLGPSTQYDVIGKLSNGNTIQVYSVEDNWAKVQFGGQTGYVSLIYLNMDSPSTGSTPSESVVKNRIIVLDAGHGGKDPGTSGNELFEKEITLDVEKRVEAKLKKAGANVILTRSSDTFPTLEDRVGIAKRNNAEIFVSIHANSGEPSANGTETYYDTSKNLSGGESKKLANEIQKQITALLGMNSRGIKEEAFYVLRNNNMPSVLIELGFVTNKKDAEKLNSDKYRDLFAEAIFRGIVNYFKM